MAVFNPKSDSYLITSLEGESLLDNAQTYKRYKNYFQMIFKNMFSIAGPTLSKAAKDVGANAKIDSFDLNSIEVKSTDLKSFIKSLQSILSATY